MIKPKVTIICKGCGKTFDVNQSVVAYRLYCTRDCYYEDKGFRVKKLAKIIK